MFFSLVSVSASSSQTTPGTVFSDYIQSGELFGRKLLLSASEQDPDKNIAISPSPLQMTFDALLFRGTSGPAERELSDLFGLGNHLEQVTASQMLRVRIPNAKPVPAKPARANDSILRHYSSHMGDTSELWSSSVFNYSGQNAIDLSIAKAIEREYGIHFEFLHPTDRTPILPSGVKPDFFIASTTHLRTAWNANTFVNSEPTKTTFALRNGDTAQVESLTSEMEAYAHIKNDDYEAIVLTGVQAYIVLVLPAQGETILELERKLAANRLLLLEQPAKEMGDVSMPPFHVRYNSELRPAFEKLGVREIFKDFNSLRPLVIHPDGAVLKSVSQQVNLDVDAFGIRADAETSFAGNYGGVLAAQFVPFHMVINRPFLFFVRDNVTNALLFTGAIMSPNNQ